jgi:hypothetical protein
MTGRRRSSARLGSREASLERLATGGRDRRARRLRRGYGGGGRVRGSPSRVPGRAGRARAPHSSPRCIASMNVVADLRSLLGAECVMDEPAVLAAYATDTWPLRLTQAAVGGARQARPLRVVQPASTQQVATCMRWLYGSPCFSGSYRKRVQWSGRARPQHFPGVCEAGSRTCGRAPQDRRQT